MSSMFSTGHLTIFEMVFFATVIKDFIHFEVFYRNIHHNETALTSQNRWVILAFVFSLIVSCVLASFSWSGWFCGWLVILVWEMLNEQVSKIPSKGP